MLNREIPTPLYIQLENIIRKQIQSKNWPENEKIPSENQLSKEYGLSRMTVRSVITNLVNEGLLFRIQGKGTFVSPRKISAYSPAYMGIREQLEQQGYIITTDLVHLETMIPSPAIAAALELPPHQEVHFIERVRFADQIPVSLHKSYIPQRLCSELSEEELITKQLCHILANQFDLITHSVHETLESIVANEEQARLLHVSEGHPLLLLKEQSYLPNKQVFEYAEIIFRGDRIKLSFDFQK